MRAVSWLGRSAACLGLALLCFSGRQAFGHDLDADMTEGARNFLAALTPEQKAKTVFALDDKERQNWHFIPRERRGLPLKEMTPAQRHLAFGLLSTGLSHRGYLKTTTIMSLEDILRDVEQGRGPVRDPELYFFTVFGDPGPKAGWGWRVEGHHLSLNFTVAGGHVAVTPSLLGTNPAEVRQGPRAGLRVLAREEDLGRQLVNSLDAGQRQECIFSVKAPADIITGPGRKAALLEPKGLAAAKMNAEQKTLLRELVDEYVRRYRPELAAEDLRKIEAGGWDHVAFAWAGGVEPRQGCYYRVQGPSFILEFDNTQNNANHIHSVWRDFKDDFGEDLLRQHYEATPHAEP